MVNQIQGGGKFYITSKCQLQNTRYTPLMYFRWELKIGLLIRIIEKDDNQFSSHGCIHMGWSWRKSRMQCRLNETLRSSCGLCLQHSLKTSAIKLSHLTNSRTQMDTYGTENLRSQRIVFALRLHVYIFILKRIWSGLGEYAMMMSKGIFVPADLLIH